MPDVRPSGREESLEGQFRIEMHTVTGHHGYNRKDQSRKDIPAVRDCGGKPELNNKHIRTRSPLNRKGKASNTWHHMRYPESPDSSTGVIPIRNSDLIIRHDRGMEFSYSRGNDQGRGSPKYPRSTLFRVGLIPDLSGPPAIPSQGQRLSWCDPVFPLYPRHLLPAECP